MRIRFNSTMETNEFNKILIKYHATNLGDL